MYHAAAGPNKIPWWGSPDVAREVYVEDPCCRRTYTECERSPFDPVGLITAFSCFFLPVINSSFAFYCTMFSTHCNALSATFYWCLLYYMYLTSSPIPSDNLFFSPNFLLLLCHVWLSSSVSLLPPHILSSCLILIRFHVLHTRERERDR